VAKKLREFKIKRYKQKKVKVKKDDPIKNFHLYFRLEIETAGVNHVADQVFDIIIPAKGYYQARQTLEELVMRKLKINVLDFESESEPICDYFE